MRLTVIGLNYGPEPTGIAVYTTGLAEALVRDGTDVTVVTGLPHYPQWRISDGFVSGPTRESGVSIRRVNHRVPSSPRLINRLLMELDFGIRAVVSPWSRPDVVVMVSPALFSTGLGVLRARLLRTRTVIWVQDIYSLGIAQSGTGGRSAGRIVRGLEQLILGSGSTVIVIHDRFKRYLVEELGLDPARVEVVRNWSHVQRADSDRDAVRRERGWGPDDVVALHAGNMGSKQNLENVVVASRLAEKSNSRVRFVLLGDGNQRARLKQMGGNRNLEFIDPVDGESFMPTLAAADILLVNERPGLTEMSVPSKLTSYFSTGRPVVAATDASSTTAEEIERSGGGIRVSPSDPAALLEAVETLGADAPSARRLGSAGLNFRAEVLSPESAMGRFASILGVESLRSTSRQ